MTTTLRGVFPEQKPPCKRNFIKENMKYIKQMQGLLPDNRPSDDKNKNTRNKLKNLPAKLSGSKQKPTATSFPTLKLQKNTKSNKSLGARKRTPEETKKTEPSKNETATESRLTDRGVQTERPQDVFKLYEKGIILYPRKQKKTIKRREDHGDSISRDTMHTGDLEDKLENFTLHEKNHIKENIAALKHRSPKLEKENNDKTSPPVNYQKGVVPKYLKNRRDEKEIEFDPECPPGHVLLPDEERKETLRVLRQSYADRIQELNSMPVRNDTLRMRKRKMEIEEELKKIDEGIKVFQRPKVFVKINA